MQDHHRTLVGAEEPQCPTDGVTCQRRSEGIGRLGLVVAERHERDDPATAKPTSW